MPQSNNSSSASGSTASASVEPQQSNEQHQQEAVPPANQAPPAALQQQPTPANPAPADPIAVADAASPGAAAANALPAVQMPQIPQPQTARASPAPDAPAPPPPTSVLGPSTTTSALKRDTPSLGDAIRNNLLGPEAAEFADVVFVTPSESSTKEVRVDLSAQSLRQVIHFAYTDSTPLLDQADAAIKAAQKNAEANSDDKKNAASTPSLPPGAVLGMPPRASARSDDDGPPPRKRRALDGVAKAPCAAKLVELVCAADYVHLPALTNRARDTVLELTSMLPGTACSAYEAARASPDAACKYLCTRLAALIRRVPHDVLGVPDVREPSQRGEPDPPVLVFSEGTLHEILADKDLFTSETYLFQVVFHWVARKPLFEVKRPLQENDPVLVGARKDSDRWEGAKRLLNHIDLERLKPSFVVDYVVPSGLVPHERAYKTFMRQALEAERGRPLFDNFRGGSRWADGTKQLQAKLGSPTNFPLETPWISSGRHEWTFRIVRNSHVVWLGFARTPPPKSDRMFFDGGHGWAFSTGGTLRPESGTEVVRQAGGTLASGPLVWEGGVVKLILNLTKSGTFTVVVDGGPKTFLAFRELKAKSKYFLPVVCASSPAKIELVSERHLV